MVRIVHGHKSFMHRLTENTTYSILKEEVFVRMKIKAELDIRLVYFTPGSVECLLQTEEDLKMLIYAGKTYGLDIVDITVKGVVDIGGNNVGRERSEYCEDYIEDEYLGLPFRRGENASFMSDEWGVYYCRGPEVC